MRELALTDMERAGAFEDAERTFQMTEEAFRVFYEQTARPIWVYLARTTGDDRLADDLLQETYYRFLRTRTDVRERRSSPSLPVSHRHQSRSRISGAAPARMPSNSARRQTCRRRDEDNAVGDRALAAHRRDPRARTIEAA